PPVTGRTPSNVPHANAALARPGMSVETAVAVSTPDNVSATERGNRVACSFDPSKDMVERSLTKLPEHPGLGRARPSGLLWHTNSSAAGTLVGEISLLIPSPLTPPDPMVPARREQSSTSST